MADVVKCDKCGKMIESKGERKYCFSSGDGELSIELGDLDWCPKCAKKSIARLAKAAWEENRGRRKVVVKRDSGVEVQD